jgi:hypothetical protein
VPSYDIAIASLAIDAPQKWIDNLLSQHFVPDVVMEKRGVARKISYGAVVRLALARELHVVLGMSVREALALAESLLEPSDGGVHVRGHLRVTVDRSGLERALNERLREALESAPTPRRGRPPQRQRSSIGLPPLDAK